MDFFPGYLLPFIFSAEVFQIPEPLQTSFQAAAFVILICRNDLVFLSVPFFIEQPYKELFHRHLGHPVYIQIRQDTGNIVQQYTVASDNIKVLRTKGLLIIIQNIRNPVHGHCCLSGTGHTLDDHIGLWGFTDDLVLLFLYRCNDLSQNCFLALCQVFVQQFVCSYNI